MLGCLSRSLRRCFASGPLLWYRMRSLVGLPFQLFLLLIKLRFQSPASLRRMRSYFDELSLLKYFIYFNILYIEYTIIIFNLETGTSGEMILKDGWRLVQTIVEGLHCFLAAGWGYPVWQPLCFVAINRHEPTISATPRPATEDFREPLRQLGFDQVVVPRPEKQQKVPTGRVDGGN